MHNGKQKPVHGYRGQRVVAGNLGDLVCLYENSAQS
jgi:hypothetical protein